MISFSYWTNTSLFFFSPEWNSLEHRPCPRLLFTSNSCGISHCVIIVLEEPISRAKGGVPCLVLSYVELCFIWLNSKMNSWLIPFFSQNINIVQSLCPYLFPPMCYFFLTHIISNTITHRMFPNIHKPNSTYQLHCTCVFLAKYITLLIYNRFYI